MSQIIRRTLGLRWFLVLGLIVCSAAIWAWQAHGQNSSNTSAQTTSQSSVSRQATRGSWECQKFIFGQENNPGRNTIRDLEGFLQAATQVTMTSSGVSATGPYAGHYDLVACRQP